MGRPYPLDAAALVKLAHKSRGHATHGLKTVSLWLLVLLARQDLSAATVKALHWDRIAIFHYVTRRSVAV